MRTGAIYWIKEAFVLGDNEDKVLTSGTYLGWDINYFTFDFNGISGGSLFGNGAGNYQSDACFIRCVDRK